MYLFFALTVGLGGIYFHNEDRLQGKNVVANEIKQESEENEERLQVSYKPVMNVEFVLWPGVLVGKRDTEYGNKTDEGANRSVDESVFLTD